MRHGLVPSINTLFSSNLIVSIVAESDLLISP